MDWIPSLDELAVDPALAALVVGWLIAVELAKTTRWWALFGPGRPAFGVCLRALIAGQVANQLSPVRAGEAVRLGVLAAQGGPLVPGTAALAAAKAIDVVCLAAIALAVLGSAALGRSQLALAAAALVAAAAFALALSGSGLRERLERTALGRRLRLASIAEVGQALRDPRVIGTVAVTTVLVWACGLAANWAVVMAVGATPTLDMAARVIVLGYLAGMLPAPPGRLGVYEAGVAAALTSAGLPLADAIAAGIALHVCQLIELGTLAAASTALMRRSKLAS